jgi:uncharacterized protein (TIGR02246 family)
MGPTDDGDIRSLLARLAQLADGGDVDDYAQLFTVDAVWVVPDVPQTGVVGVELRGRAAIADAAAARRADGVQGPGTHTAHLVTTTAVQFEGDDAAVADSCWQFLVETATAPRIQAVGRYRDDLRRTDGAWRLARREIVLG